MSLSVCYEPLGRSGATYYVGPVDPVFVKNLEPICLRMDVGVATFQDYLSARDARRLAYALIEEANKAENPSLREAA